MDQNAITIRSATAADIPSFAEIERDAAHLYAAANLSHLTTETLPAAALETMIARQTVWAATTATAMAGFAAARPLATALHLEELSVRASFQRRGVGRALLARVVAAATEAAFPAVTLCTFRDLPWCAPFYAREGFAVVPEPDLSDQLRAARLSERAAGLEPPPRVAMICRLDGA